jgi:hypothetical protein
VEHGLRRCLAVPLFRSNTIGDFQEAAEHRGYSPSVVAAFALSESHPTSIPAWREDNRRVSNGDQVGRVASLAMKRGKSVDFHRLLAAAHTGLMMPDVGRRCPLTQRAANE